MMPQVFNIHPNAKIWRVSKKQGARKKNAQVLFTIHPRLKNWQVLKNCQNDAPSVQYSTKLQNLVSAQEVPKTKCPKCLNIHPNYNIRRVPKKGQKKI
jgi:hypothetical protein